MEKFKTKVLPLSKIKANQQNPRVISESRLKKLINSLLVFPAMLSLRPIVIDDNNVILGGNMRQTALSRIWVKQKKSSMLICVSAPNKRIYICQKTGHQRGVRFFS